MIQFIAQYWLQFLFGLIITGMGIALKKVWGMYKKEQTRKRDEEKEELLEKVEERMTGQEGRLLRVIDTQHQEMIEADAKIAKEIVGIDTNVQLLDKNLNKLTDGLLPVQRTIFVQACKDLLNAEHKISTEEFERLVQDHKAYNNLGGNSIGDKYFNLVEKKFDSQITE